MALCFGKLSSQTTDIGKDGPTWEAACLRCQDSMAALLKLSRIEIALAKFQIAWQAGPWQQHSVQPAACAAQHWRHPPSQPVPGSHSSITGCSTVTILVDKVIIKIIQHNGMAAQVADSPCSPTAAHTTTTSPLPPCCCHPPPTLCSAGWL